MLHGWMGTWHHVALLTTQVLAHQAIPHTLLETSGGIPAGVKSVYGCVL